jgi:hypothetical protein
MLERADIAEATGLNRCKRDELMNGDYLEPPRVTTVYRFLPQTGGVIAPAVGTPNEKLFEVTGQFSEMLTHYAY